MFTNSPFSKCPLHTPFHIIACRRRFPKIGRYNVVFNDNFLFYVGSAFAHLPSAACIDEAPRGKAWASHYTKAFSVPLEDVLPWKEAGDNAAPCLWATWDENQPSPSA